MLVSEANSEQAHFTLRREVWDLPVVARFTVLGEPISKARARIVKGHAYTPKRTLDAEAQMADHFRVAAPSWVATDRGSFGVVALFFAASRQRRDVDNMVKLVLDGLNKVAWADDDQVREISARKGYVTDPDDARTEVLIYSMPDNKPGLGTIVCAQCGATFPKISPGDKRRYCSRSCANESKRKVALSVCKADGCEKVCEKGRAYCSGECHIASCRVDLVCARCETSFVKFKSWARNGLPFCSDACRAAHWRDHRSVAARGVCSDCGGHTSKTKYTRCRSCAIAARQPVVGGTEVVITLEPVVLDGAQ